MKKIKQLLSIGLLLLVTLFCCTKADDYKKHMSYKKYPGKVDSVSVLTGNKRAIVRMKLNNDPSVKKVVVYWNNGNDSIEINVAATQHGGYIKQVVSPLAEGSYQFTMYSIDANGNRSIPTSAQGAVLGDTYLSTLSNRPLRNVELSDDGISVVTAWSVGSEGEAGVEIVYETEDGGTRQVIMPASRTTFTFADYKENGLMKYRSLFIPSELAVDTFAAPYSQATLPAFERIVAKTGFKELVLPTDTRHAYGWVMSNLWDGKVKEPGFHTPPGVGLPIWYTFDIGASLILSKLKIWQRVDNNFIFNRGNPKKFELWGWASSSAPANGSWTGWEKIGSFESIKPSSLPLGTVNDEDRRKAAEGEAYPLAATDKSYRYLRIKILKTYSGEDFTHLLELSLWTKNR